MNICIVGAGAIGGFMGARLAAQGHAVSALARGETLKALQQHGWRLRMADGTELHAPCRAAAKASELGVQDVVVLAVKAQALAELAPALKPLIGPNTLLLPAMNGVTWWFLQATPALAGARIASVDAHGSLAAHLPTAQTLGCVVHASAATSAPGLVEHKMGSGLIVGEPAGGLSERAQAMATMLREAGFESKASPDIRRDLWFKLWGNLVMNPITALTNADSHQVLDDPLVRELCSQCMREASAVGAAIGCGIAQTPEDRHAVTRKLGAFRTSMQQDANAGRSLELDAIVTAVHDIARHVGVPTPGIDALLGLTRLFAQVRGLYPT